MVSFIEKVDIYEVKVNPCKSITWTGKFNFKPNAEDVTAAILQDIDKLDEDVEHESDMIQSLRQTLELVTFTGPELLGKVSIAGTYLGEISIAIIKIFAKEKQSMLPVMSIRDSHLDGTGHIPRDNPCGEIPLDDSVPRRDCMGPTEEDF